MRASVVTAIDLVGSVALLLWAVRMVQTGVQRGFGSRLREVLARALRSRGEAFAAGVAVTAVLQSSTATGLMVSGFAAEGLVGLVPALAVMLGANVGTTLIVQLLSVDVSGLPPILIFAGVLMFRRGTETRTRDFGRAAIGLGLMLMSLHQLVAAVQPYETSARLEHLLAVMSAEPLLLVLLAAALTWAAHSSVAIVLMVVSFASKGLVTPEAAFALVLGANLGTAINPLVEGIQSSDPAARRLPTGNMVNRVVGCFVVLAMLPVLTPWLTHFMPSAGRSVAMFHTVFNLVMAFIFFPLLTPYAALLRHCLPERTHALAEAQPLYLAASAAEVPAIAIEASAREALRLADMLKENLARALELLTGGDRKLSGECKRTDGYVEQLHLAIKSYLAVLDPEALDDADHARIQSVLLFANNIEHASGVVARNLMHTAARQSRLAVPLPEQDRQQLRSIVGKLLVNLEIAVIVFNTARLHEPFIKLILETRCHRRLTKSFSGGSP
jgi:phosphate:Na+ symporter